MIGTVGGREPGFAHYLMMYWYLLVFSAFEGNKTKKR